MRSLKEISHDSYYKMGDYHQITIDFIESAEDLFNCDAPEDEEEKRDLLNRLGCLSYDISVCLEVFNPEFKIEISDLKDIDSLIDIRIAYVDTLEFKPV